MTALGQFIQNRIIPEPLSQALLVRRRSPLWRRAGVVFVHVPKAAGTSINEALYGRFMGHVPAAVIDHSAPADVRGLPMFTVVRNPWDRCVSAWHFARAGSGMGEGAIAAVYRPEQYHVPEFQDFDRFIEEWLATREPDRLDPIFRTQCHYTGRGSDLNRLDFIGRVEAMDGVARWLSGQIGREIVLGRTNYRAREGRDYRSLYSARTRDLVARLYACDIEAFGYDF